MLKVRESRWIVVHTLRGMEWGCLPICLRGKDRMRNIGHASMREGYDDDYDDDDYDYEYLRLTNK